MVGNHFEHPQDGPKGKVQDVLCKEAALRHSSFF
ncbi:MAG: hypothetical protein ACJA13_000980, partial [Paraglaciecola sp.]